MFQSLSFSRKIHYLADEPLKSKKSCCCKHCNHFTRFNCHLVLKTLSSFNPIYPNLCSNHSSLEEPPGRDFPVLCSGHPGWCRDHLEKTKSNEIRNNSGEFGGYWLWIPIVMEIESLHPSDQRPLNMLQTHITVHNSLHWFTLRSRQTGWGRVCVNAKT